MKKVQHKRFLSLTTKDGAQIKRTIRLVDDAVRFETALKAKKSRPFHFFVHPEYDAGSNSNDPEEVGIYVKADGWHEGK